MFKKADINNLAKKALYSKKALNTLFDAIYPMIWHFYRIRLNDLEDVKDMTQNGCIKIMQNIEKFDSARAAFTTWIYTIIQNLLFDYFKKKSLKIDDMDLNLLEGTDSPSEQIIKKEQLDKIDESIKMLSKREKEIFELKFFFNMKNKEIASALKLDEKTVSSVLFKATERIKAILKRLNYENL